MEVAAAIAPVPPWRRHGKVAEGLRPFRLHAQRHGVRQIFLEKVGRLLDPLNLIFTERIPRRAMACYRHQLSLGCLGLFCRRKLSQGCLHPFTHGRNALPAVRRGVNQLFEIG